MSPRHYLLQTVPDQKADHGQGLTSNNSLKGVNTEQFVLSDSTVCLPGRSVARTTGLKYAIASPCSILIECQFSDLAHNAYQSDHQMTNDSKFVGGTE